MVTFPIESCLLTLQQTEAIAKKGLAPYDAKLSKLKAELNALVDNLTKTSQKVKSESEAALKGIEKEVENISTKIKAQYVIWEGSPKIDC